MRRIKYKTIKIRGFHEDIDKLMKAAKDANTTLSMFVIDCCMLQIDKIIKVKYTGEENVSLIYGNIYTCLEYSRGNGHNDYMRIIDESGEAYYYSPDDFEIVN